MSGAERLRPGAALPARSPAATTAPECPPSLPCAFREDRCSAARRDALPKHVSLEWRMIIADVRGSLAPAVPFTLEGRVTERPATGVFSVTRVSPQRHLFHVSRTGGYVSLRDVFPEAKYLGGSFGNGDGKKFQNHSSRNGTVTVSMAFARFAVRSSSEGTPFSWATWPDDELSMPVAGRRCRRPRGSGCITQDAGSSPGLPWKQTCRDRHTRRDRTREKQRHRISLKNSECDHHFCDQLFGAWKIAVGGSVGR